MIHAYIARDHMRTAGTVVRTIHHTVSLQLTTAPLSGRPGRIKGTRELVVPHLPYVVAYRIRDDAAQVLRVLHTSIRWPDML